MRANFETGLKICSRCHKELPINSFNKNKNSSDGLDYICKECQHIYYISKKDQIIKRVISYQRNEGKEVYKKANNKYSQTEKGKKSRRCVEVNAREYKANWRRNRYKNDIDFQIRSLLRNRLRSTIINGYKSAHTLELLGCSIDELKVHLEQQFEPGMTWENRGKGKGKWQIDHIIPCSYFDLTKEENQRICFNYRNLQPLWASENNSKNNSVPDNVEELVEFLKKEIYNNGND